MSYSLRLRKAGAERVRAAVDGAADVLGLGALLERRPKALSGGQRQRVAMGRAIVRKPRAFLFDEPLSNLDARLRERMRAEIRKLHGELGATSVYVTHDQIEAMTMGDRIVAMHGGVVQQVGTPREIYERPANRFVAGFIGSPAMNFLDARVERGGGGARLATAFGTLEAALPDAVAGGTEVALGVRPEDLSVVAEGDGASGSGARLAGTVRMLEYAGASTLAHLAPDVGASSVGTRSVETLRAVLPGAAAHAVGDRLRLAVAPGRLHPFAAGDGRRLDGRG